jgi:hypothetical protein
VAAANVVEILIKAANQTQAGMAEAKADAESAAEGADTLAAAQDKQAGSATSAEAATARYAETQKAQASAAAQLAELEKSDAASAEELTVATNTLTDASVKAAAARRDLTVMTKSAADEQVAAGVKSDEAGGLMAGMGSKVKLAGLGVAVGMGLAVKSAMDFQKQTTTWVTSAGESASQLGMLQQGVLDLSAQTATSSGELSKGLYTISSAGISGASGLNVLKAAAEGAKSEGADLGEVTNALTSGINAYGMKVGTSAQATTSATSMMNQMLQTVAQGKMTFQELAGSLSAVLPIAAASKVSYADVGGALATMTSMGVSARQGTQDLAFTIRTLANPTSVATNEMAQFGISSTDVSSKLGQRGLTGTVEYLSAAVTSKMGPAGTVIVNAMNQSKSAASDAQEMLGKLPASIQGVAKSYLDGSISTKTWTTDLKAMPPLQANLAKEWANVANQSHSFNNLLKSGSPAAQTYAAAMSKLLGGATGLNVGLMLTGSHASTVEKNVKAIGAAANGTSGQVSGFNEVQKTTAFQMAKAGDSIKAAGTSLGLALLPAVNAVLAPLASFLSMIAQNKAAAIAFAVVIGGVLAGAIGTKAVHAVTEFKGAVEATVGGVEKLVGKITGLGSAQEKAAAASKKASADSAAASEESASKQEAASGRAAAAAETDAGSVAAANETAATESADKYAWMAAKQEAASGEAAAAAETDAAGVSAANEEAAVQSSGSWLKSATSAIGSAAKWVAEGIAKVAMVVAENVAGAATTAAAWVIANGVMLLGIVAVVALVAIAVYEIVTHWKSIVHGVEEAWNAVYKFVSGIVSDVVNFVKSHWMLLLGILLGPIALAVAAIITYRKQIVSVFEGLWRDVSGFASRLGSDVLHFFEKMFSDVTGAVSRGVGVIVGWAVRLFDEFISTEERGLTNIVHFFEGLPGRIISAVSSLAGMLTRVGENAIKGLLSGAASMVSGAVSTVAGWGHDIANALGAPFGIHFSEPSEATQMIKAGKNIPAALAKGITSGSPAVRSAMAGLAGNASASSAGSLALTGAGAAGANAKVTFDFTGAAQDPFVKAVRQAVRILGGGNVQKAFGSG